jgi:hypothetical protein
MKSVAALQSTTSEALKALVARHPETATESWLALYRAERRGAVTRPERYLARAAKNIERRELTRERRLPIADADSLAAPGDVEESVAANHELARLLSGHGELLRCSDAMDERDEQEEEMRRSKRAQWLHDKLAPLASEHGHQRNTVRYFFANLKAGNSERREPLTRELARVHSEACGLWDEFLAAGHGATAADRGCADATTAMGKIGELTDNAIAGRRGAGKPPVFHGRAPTQHTQRIEHQADMLFFGVLRLAGFTGADVNLALSHERRLERERFAKPLKKLGLDLSWTIEGKRLIEEAQAEDDRIYAAHMATPQGQAEEMAIRASLRAQAFADAQARDSEAFVVDGKPGVPN